MKITPEAVQEALDELERRGAVRRTGEIRGGKPVYVATEKSMAEWKEEQEQTKRMREACPPPDDYIGRRLYMLEMWAELAEHYGVEIQPNEIERHIALTLERQPDGKWVDSYMPLTDAGEELAWHYEEERRQQKLAEAEGREFPLRAWTWKLTSQQ
jgi:hypothetical protein